MRRTVFVLAAAAALAACGGGGGDGSGTSGGDAVVRSADVGSVAQATEILAGEDLQAPALELDEELDAARRAALERLEADGLDAEPASP
jgi:hypothetical protein